MDATWDAASLEVSHLATAGEPVVVADLVDLGQTVLEGSRHIDGGHDHRADAEALLTAVRPESPDRLERLPKQLRDRYLALVARRAAGEPLGHLVGHVTFGAIEVGVRHGVFVPRPSSVWTAEQVVDLIRQRECPVVVDVCSGAGAIALSVAHAVPHAEVWGTDISPVACQQARRNADRLGLDNARFRRGDAYGRLPRRLRQRVDAIVGYVPYLTNEDIAGLQAEIGAYEPLHTLTDLSEDGFGLVRRIVGDATAWLRPRGELLIQIDADTATRLAGIVADAGLTEIRQVGEHEGWDVVVRARRPDPTVGTPG